MARIDELLAERDRLMAQYAEARPAGPPSPDFGRYVPRQPGYLLDRETGGLIPQADVPGFGGGGAPGRGPTPAHRAMVIQRPGGGALLPTLGGAGLGLGAARMAQQFFAGAPAWGARLTPSGQLAQGAPDILRTRQYPDFERVAALTPGGVLSPESIGALLPEGGAMAPFRPEIGWPGEGAGALEFPSLGWGGVSPFPVEADVMAGGMGELGDQAGWLGQGLGAAGLIGNLYGAGRAFAEGDIGRGVKDVLGAGFGAAGLVTGSPLWGALPSPWGVGQAYNALFGRGGLFGEGPLKPTTEERWAGGVLRSQDDFIRAINQAHTLEDISTIYNRVTGGAGTTPEQFANPQFAMDLINRGDTLLNTGGALGGGAPASLIGALMRAYAATPDRFMAGPNLAPDWWTGAAQSYANLLTPRGEIYEPGVGYVPAPPERAVTPAESSAQLARMWAADPALLANYLAGFGGGFNPNRTALPDLAAAMVGGYGL